MCGFHKYTILKPEPRWEEGTETYDADTLVDQSKNSDLKNSLECSWASRIYLFPLPKEISLLFPRGCAIASPEAGA